MKHGSIPLEDFRLRGLFFYSHGRGSVHSGRFSAVSICCAGMSVAEAEVFAEYSVLWYDSNKSGFVRMMQNEL